MLENLLVGVALMAHDCRSYLAHTYSVTPAVPAQDEARRHSVLVDVQTFHLEGGTLQVRFGECAANFQFLADDECAFGAHDLQSDDAPTLASLDGMRSLICPKFNFN